MAIAERVMLAKFTAQTKELTKGISQVNGSISSVSTTTEKTNSKLGGIAKSMGKTMVVAGAAAATALVAVGGAAVKTGIKTASAMEQAKISFTTMLGSAQKADAFLRDLAKFAAETPFEFPELQTAASSLVSAGINADKVIPIMRTLGDVTSGMGTGSEGIKRATVALQQMNAAQKISGEDLNQLRDAGIPVYDLLAKALGKSKGEVVKLAQSGKLGKDALDKMMQALESGKGLERFNGLMEKQSKSLAGIWSNMKDTFQMGMAKAVQPLLPLIKEGLGGAMKALSGLMPFVQKGFTAFAKVAQPALAVILPLIENIGPALSGMAGSMSPVAIGFKLISGLMPELVKLFKTLGPVIMDLAKIIGQGVSDAIAALLPVLAELIKVLGPVLVQVLKALMPVVGTLIKSFVSLLPPILSIIKALLPLIPVVGQLVVALAPLLQILAELVAAFGPLIVVVAQLISSIVSQLVPAFQAVMPVVALVAKILGEGIATGAKIVIAIIQQIVKAFTWMFNVLVGGSIVPDLVKGILRWFGRLFSDGTAVIRKLVNTIVGLFQWLWSKLGAIAAGIRDSVVSRVRQLRDWALAAFRGLRDSANSIMDTARRWVVGRMTSLRDGVRSMANSARDAALNAFRYIRDKVGGIFSSAVSNISKVWGGLKNVLKAPISFLIDTVINKGLIGAFNWVARKVGAHTIGGLHIAGFDQGGWTGPGQRKKVAGAVHADEFVVRKSSRRRFEASHPGWLDYLNRTGQLPGYATGGRVNLRGKTFTARFAAAIQNAQKLAKTIFSLFQGGFRPATSYSGTSHAKDAVDLGPINAKVVRALRASGIAAWDRTGMGNWMPHIHGVPLPGFGTPGGSAVWQAQDYLRGGNGLGGRDNGAGSGYRPWPISGSQAAFFDLPSWMGKFKDVTKYLRDKIADSLKADWANNWWAQTISHVPGMIMSTAATGLGDLGQSIKEGFKEKFSFDSGGWLPPGVSLAVNRTGHPEPIGWDQLGREPSQVITINVHGALDPDAVARQIQRLLADHDSRRGGVIMPSRTRVSTS
jgi:tape measure domain-containing protein